MFIHHLTEQYVILDQNKKIVSTSEEIYNKNLVKYFIEYTIEIYFLSGKDKIGN